jgi:hypothetical protein
MGSLEDEGRLDHESLMARLPTKIIDALMKPDDYL